MKFVWWILQTAGALISIFFVIFGIDLMMAAYGLEDPFSFIMTFFAASFMLSISIPLFLGFIVKMFRAFRGTLDNDKTPEEVES